MVNLLEGLYITAALSFLVSFVLIFRGRRATARKFAILGAASGLLSLALYLYLSPSA
jgi:hypothetical protein